MDAFIFARGGSKGIPNKNIANFAGKPLIAWTIEFGLSLKFIDRVFVSTDSSEIAKISLDFGAEIPFMRPAELAKDESSEWLAWRHAINFIYKNDELLPKEFLTLPTTSPLRAICDVEEAVANFRRGGADAVITMSEARRHPSFNMIKRTDNNFVNLLDESDKNKSNRQSFNPVFDMATVCYVASPRYVLGRSSLFDGNVRGTLVPPERAIDIDTQLDFELAEYLFMKKKGTK
jgi:N-acylneuraminate cytidylyltransferase